MGFHKRFITKDTILLTKENQLNTLFSSDALLFGDDWSMDFYQLFKEGYKKEEIIKKIYENEDSKKEQ